MTKGPHFWVGLMAGLTLVSLGTFGLVFGHPTSWLAVWPLIYLENNFWMSSFLISGLLLLSDSLGLFKFSYHRLIIWWLCAPVLWTISGFAVIPLVFSSGIYPFVTISTFGSLSIIYTILLFKLANVKNIVSLLVRSPETEEELKDRE